MASFAIASLLAVLALITLVVKTAARAASGRKAEVPK